MNVERLIALAAAKTGSEYQVAKAIGATQQRLNDWKHHRAQCSAEDRALLADVAGVDPFPEIKEAMLERWAGKPKAEALARVWAKWGESRIFAQLSRWMAPRHQKTAAA